MSDDIPVDVAMRCPDCGELVHARVDRFCGTVEFFDLGLCTWGTDPAHGTSYELALVRNERALEAADIVRRATAYHEAGHVAARVYLGRPFARVTIEPTDEAAGHVATGYWPGFLAEESGTAAAPNARQRRIAEAEIMSSFAGPLAEGRYRARDTLADDDAEGDRERVAFIASSLSGSAEQASALLDVLLERTRALVQGELWPAIERLAAALLVHGRLTGAAARQLVRDVGPDERAAYHVAGHAVAAVLRHVPFAHVSLTAGLDLTLAVAWLAQPDVSTARRTRRARRVIEVCLAGAEAARWFAPDRAPGSCASCVIDAGAWMLARCANPETFRVAAYARLARRLPRHAARMHAVTTRLIEVGTLTAADVEALCRESAAVHR